MYLMRVITVSALCLLACFCAIGQTRRAAPSPSPTPLPPTRVVPTRVVTINLKEGAPVTGKFIGADANHIQVEVAGNYLNIALDSVASVIFDPEAAAKLTPSNTVMAVDSSSEAANNALKILRRMAGATEVGINFQDYGSRVVDAKGELDEALAKIPEGDIKKELSAALVAYVDAAQIWNLMLDPRYDFVLLQASPIVPQIAERYSIPVDRRFSYPTLRGRSAIMATIWQAARSHIDNAARLLQK